MIQDDYYIISNIEDWEETAVMWSHISSCSDDFGWDRTRMVSVNV